jgi:hypothetical protein
VFNLILDMQADGARHEAVTLESGLKETPPHSSQQHPETKELNSTKHIAPLDSPVQPQCSAYTSKGTHCPLTPLARGLSVATTSTNSGTATAALNHDATPDPSAGPVATFSDLHEGSKSAEEGVPCMLEAVATRDSVSDYATQSAAPMEELPPDATVQERKEYLEEQLDRLTNKVLGDYLLVLPGTHNRLAGGALPLKCTCSLAASPYLYATGVLHDARPFALL